MRPVRPWRGPRAPATCLCFPPLSLGVPHSLAVPPTSGPLCSLLSPGPDHPDWLLWLVQSPGSLHPSICAPLHRGGVSVYPFLCGAPPSLSLLPRGVSISRDVTPPHLPVLDFWRTLGSLFPSPPLSLFFARVESPPQGTFSPSFSLLVPACHRLLSLHPPLSS